MLLVIVKLQITLSDLPSPPVAMYEPSGLKRTMFNGFSCLFNSATQVNSGFKVSAALRCQT